MVCFTLSHPGNWWHQHCKPFHTVGGWFTMPISNDICMWLTIITSCSFFSTLKCSLSERERGEKHTPGLGHWPQWYPWDGTGKCIVSIMDVYKEGDKRKKRGRKGWEGKEKKKQRARRDSNTVQMNSQRLWLQAQESQKIKQAIPAWIRWGESGSPTPNSHLMASRHISFH